MVSSNIQDQLPVGYSFHSATLKNEQPKQASSTSLSTDQPKLMSTSQPPNLAFTKALPKVELHAHLTGSISKQCLHNIWLAKKSANPGFALEDPLIAIPSAKDGGIDVVR